MTQELVDSRDQLTDCWFHVYLSADRKERSSGQFRRDVRSATIYAGITAIHISYNAGLALIPYIG